MIKRFILYAGLPKTATTTIQNACFSQRQALLEDQGILYPGNEPNHTNALCTAFLSDPRQHISNKMAGCRDKAVLLTRASDIRNRFVQEITATRPETVLFLAEGMSNLSKIELRAFREWVAGFGERLEVFYVARDPVAYTTSVIQQLLKGGEVLEDMYQNLPLPNFRGKFNAGLDAFGMDAVAVYAFEHMCAHPEGVVGAFLDIIKLEAGDLRQAILAGQSRDNESLSHEAARILSSLNRQRPLFVDGSLGPRRVSNEFVILANIKGKKFHLPADVIQKVIKQSADDVAWLREKFGVSGYDGTRYSGKAAPEEGLPAATVDTLAMVISNLLNDRHANTLITQARGVCKNSNIDELRRLARDIRRITPDRPVPKFLSDTLHNRAGGRHHSH